MWKFGMAAETVSRDRFWTSNSLYEQEVASTSPQAGRPVELDVLKDEAQ
jgi:hypothetical protein